MSHQTLIQNVIGFLLTTIMMAGCLRADPAPMPDPGEISRRISLDFNRNEEQVRTSLARYFPALTDSQLRAWESDGRLEMKMIDGKRRYFRNAVNNLLRTDALARRVRDSLFPPQPDPLDSICLQNSREIIDAGRSGHPVEARRITIDYTLTIDPDAVPEGELVRCWLPYPRVSLPRQQNVKLIAASPPGLVRSGHQSGHSSLYAEQTAKTGQPVTFSYRASFEVSGQWFDPIGIRQGQKGVHRKPAQKFLREEPPQVIFSDGVKFLADSLTGKETDPWQLIRRFYYWIDENIPWASAREYSTMDSIPDYVIRNRRGDCGMVTFLMISLARYKGIPARWQSGWMLHPGEENLHDWAEVWFKETGWLPLDQSFGLQKSPDPQIREFYLTGIDSYRMIVNDGFSQPFDPPKQFPRSEPFDFQRGEVEWSGGNLYFDHWDYHLKVISIEKIHD